MDLREQAKLRLSRLWLCCSEGCVLSSIATRDWIIRVWPGSSLDLFGVELGAALISLIDC